jgi:hypothetical protein
MGRSSEANERAEASKPRVNEHTNSGFISLDGRNTVFSGLVGQDDKSQKKELTNILVRSRIVELQGLKVCLGKMRKT